MIAAGLLWYDDDVRRPLAIKLAEAAERYRERVGFEPTTCLLNPAQIPSAPPATGRGSRKKIVVPAITLRLVSDEHLRPNYFFVGVGEGERPKRVRGWRGGFDEDQKDALPTRRARRVSGKAAEPARTSAPPKLAAPVTSGAPAKSTKATAAPKPAEAPRPASAIPATPTLAAQTAKKAHSRPVVAAPSSRSPEIAEAAPLRRRRAAPAADSAVPAAAPATVPAGRAARAVGSVGGSTETAAKAPSQRKATTPDMMAAPKTKAAKTTRAAARRTGASAAESASSATERPARKAAASSATRSVPPAKSVPPVAPVQPARKSPAASAPAVPAPASPRRRKTA